MDEIPAPGVPPHEVVAVPGILEGIVLVESVIPAFVSGFAPQMSFIH